jgi:hypothetical protein
MDGESPELMWATKLRKAWSPTLLQRTMSKKPTKAELAAERAKYDGLTIPESGVLFELGRIRPDCIDGFLARSARARKLLQRFIDEGYLDEKTRTPTERGKRVMKTVAGACVAPYLAK